MGESTFRYDPEAGDKVRCVHCGSTGLIKRVLRGTIYISWKQPGSGVVDRELPWCLKVPCEHCGCTTEEYY